MNKRENFGSKVGAVLAAAGSAVGLGNVWRFPIETGRNGGAAFILVYIACIIVIGLPVMMSEFLIGRSTQSNTARAYQKLAPGTPWRWVGRLGVFTAFFIMCYYGVIAGWTIGYAVLAVGDQFAGKTAADYGPMFSDYATNWWQPLLCMVAFVVLTHVVIVKGVTKGIERWSKVLMPMLFILVLVLVFCSVTLPNAGAGIDFLLKPDWSKVDGSVVLSAMGQAFFSLSLGMGCLCTYASYFDKKTSLGKTAIQVCVIDTLIALMAGFIIFPAVSSVGYSLDPKDVGANLIFITLPNVFEQAFGSMPWLGYIVSVSFYLLLSIAALTSNISLHEVCTSFLSEELRVGRKRAAAIVSVGCIVVGAFCSLSFGGREWLQVFGMSLFNLFDWFTANVCLTVGGFFTCLFVGWYVEHKIVRDELSNWGTLRTPHFHTMVFLLKYVCPVMVVLIFLHQFGLL